eukprot:snap_masked-scaffold_8-processed-gene-13.27-mRNA-1 protein AED:1.00 eAED:1.00 QI:0/-1/0/0/-1/1/1/0/385
MGRNLSKWQNSVKEEVLFPEQRIIDAHHHLWDPAREPRRTKSVAKLFRVMPYGARQALFRKLFSEDVLHWFSPYTYVAEKYVLEDFQADFGGHNVVGSVVVESGYHKSDDSPELANLGETKINARLSEKKKFPMAIAASIDLTLPRERVRLAIEAHRKITNRFSSVRHQLAKRTTQASHISPSVRLDRIFEAVEAVEKDLTIKNPLFMDNLKILAEEDLCFEAWCYFYQIPDIIAIAREVPNLKIILNHMGCRIGENVFPDQKEVALVWSELMEEVSLYPNVYVKLSGVLMPGTGFHKFHLRKVAPTSDEVVEVLYPLFHQAVSWFGVERCLFASNFPVDKTSVNYVVLVNAFKKCCEKEGLSSTQKDKLFYLNAAVLYHLDHIE